MTPSDAIRAAGLRRTPARLTVYTHIQALARPVSHAELQEHPAIAAIDAITLYRTLAALLHGSLLHRVHGIDGTWRYCVQPRGAEGCPGNHAHFLCTTCGAMACLVAQPMPRVDVPTGAVVHGRHFLVHGQCGTCNANPSQPARHGDTA